MRGFNLRQAIFVALVMVLPFSGYATAEELPRLEVPAQAKIQSNVIKLGSFARIRHTHPEHKKLADDLSSVELGLAPAPRTKTRILGAKILEAIEENGIPRNAFYYSIPKVVMLERDGRLVQQDEVKLALSRDIQHKKALDLKIREVRWDSPQVVPSGDLDFQVRPLGIARAGKLPLRVEVLSEGELVARFQATAIVDHWKSVPVANRRLERGRLIEASDIELVRLNLNQEPSDIVVKEEQLMGKQVIRTIPAGETIRHQSVEIPPLVPRGQKVVMIFTRGALRATATGVAMEHGYEGKTIKVRNENSRKIVQGQVLETGNISVITQ